MSEIINKQNLSKFLEFALKDSRISSVKLAELV